MRIRKRTTKTQRAQSRRVGGPLRTVKPKTKDLYNYSLRTFVRWVALHMAWPQTNEGLDACACAFIMMAWQEGETRALVGNLISGIGDSEPSLRQWLHGARRLHAAYSMDQKGAWRPLLPHDRLDGEGHSRSAPLLEF